MKQIKEEILKNKKDIDKYIQDKHKQNQIFHLANYFGISIKDMIILLNNENIKLSSYQINQHKFSNNKIDETFNFLNQTNLDDFFIFLKNNSFKNAEEKFKTNGKNLKFWLDIHGYDVSILTNKNKVSKMISKTLEINIEDIVDKNKLKKIKKEINKGVHWLILKEEFHELNKNKMAWNRWFEKNNLKPNKSINEEVKIIQQRKINLFETKYKTFILEKINEGYSKEHIREMIIEQFKESKKYCPVDSLINMYFKEEYKNNLENRMLRYHGTKTYNIAKTKKYKDTIQLKNRLKYQSALIFDKNNLHHKKMFQQYCVSKMITTKRPIRDLLPKSLNSEDFLNYYDEIFGKAFILNEKFFSKKESSIILNSFSKMKSLKINKTIKNIINKFILENNLKYLFNSKINLIDLTHYSIYYYCFLFIMFKNNKTILLDFFNKKTLNELNIITKQDFVDYFFKQMNFKKCYLLENANFLVNEGILLNKKINNYSSSSEQKTEKFLKRNNIKFIHEKTFEDLKLESYLRYDFYLPEFNLLIELDGAQHFKFVSYFDKNKECFEKRKMKDRLKNEYAKKNNINILRIPYYCFKDIELIICNYLINNFNYKEGKIIQEQLKYKKLKKEREQFSCPYCDKKVRSKGNLVQHINSKHNNKNKKRLIFLD